MGVLEPTNLVEWYELAKREGWLDKFLKFWCPRPKILVLGMSGAGKTQFLGSLRNDYTDVIPREIRTVVAETTRVSLAGNLIDFRDTPGDVAADDLRMSEIRKTLKRPVAGIINVVAYGYCELAHGCYEEVEAVTQGGTPNPDWLNKHRGLERKYLREWTSLVGFERSAGFLMTVCTKADLWWDERDAVRKAYTDKTGEYCRDLGACQTLSPCYCAYASKIKRFYDSVPVSRDFDERQKLALRKSLVATLLVLLNRVAQNV